MSETSHRKKKERLITVNPITPSVVTGKHDREKKHENHGDKSLRGKTSSNNRKPDSFEFRFDNLTDAIDAWEASIVNPQTRETYARWVRLFIKGLGSKPTNAITTDDITKYVNAIKSWHGRHNALAAIKSFLNYTCKRPPNFTHIYIGERPDPKMICEPTEAEMAQLWRIVDSLPLVERVAMRLLIESGHRRRAILDLPRDTIEVRPGGPVVKFPPSTQKRSTYAICPLSQGTYNLITQLLASHNEATLIPSLNMRKQSRGKWLYMTVRRAGQAAGIKQRLHPHAFRHYKALQFRREGAKEDTVINQMGWRDAGQYNSRYGRRQGYETCEESRALLHEPKIPAHMDKTPSQTISELADMLKSGKMDIQTYQASLALLLKDQKDRNLSINSISGYS